MSDSQSISEPSVFQSTTSSLETLMRDDMALDNMLTTDVLDRLTKPDQIKEMAFKLMLSHRYRNLDRACQGSTLATDAEQVFRYVSPLINKDTKPEDFNFERGSAEDFAKALGVPLELIELCVTEMTWSLQSSYQALPYHMALLCAMHTNDNFPLPKRKLETHLAWHVINWLVTGYFSNTLGLHKVIFKEYDIASNVPNYYEVKLVGSVFVYEGSLWVCTGGNNNALDIYLDIVPLSELMAPSGLIKTKLSVREKSLKRILSNTYVKPQPLKF